MMEQLNTYFTDTSKRTLDFGEKFRYMVRYMGGNGAIITVSSPRPIPERPISDHIYRRVNNWFEYS